MAPWKQADSVTPDSPARVRNALIAFGLVAVAAAFISTLGRSERVIYLGNTPFGSDDTVIIRTEPSRQYVVTREKTAPLRRGCRYDVSYSPNFFSRTPAERQMRHVRNITLVDCLAGS